MIDRLAAYAFDPWDHMRGWSWAGMSVMMLVAVVVVAWIAWAVTRRTPVESGTTALKILEERYARGEIDEEELRRRREMLKAAGA